VGCSRDREDHHGSIIDAAVGASEFKSFRSVGRIFRHPIWAATSTALKSGAPHGPLQKRPLWPGHQLPRLIARGRKWWEGTAPGDLVDERTIPHGPLVRPDIRDGRKHLFSALRSFSLRAGLMTRPLCLGPTTDVIAVESRSFPVYRTPRSRYSSRNSPHLGNSMGLPLNAIASRIALS